MPGKKSSVLFLCTHNAYRSQMAEGLLRNMFGGRYEVFSAGLEPATVSPYAVQALADAGIDISGARSKSLEEFRGMEFDFVVTLCDGTKHVCPFFPGGKNFIHQPFQDLPLAGVTEEEMLEAARRMRDQLKGWIMKTFG